MNVPESEIGASQGWSNIPIQQTLQLFSLSLNGELNVGYLTASGAGLERGHGPRTQWTWEMPPDVPRLVPKPLSAGSKLPLHHLLCHAAMETAQATSLL